MKRIITKRLFLTRCQSNSNLLHRTKKVSESLDTDTFLLRISKFKTWVLQSIKLEHPM